MMHPPTVVAVDDTLHELDAIVVALRLLDLACLPIHAQGVTLNLDAPLSSARLIFFDINYLPGVTTQTARFEVAATVLKKVVAPDSGPYTLITWTSRPDEHHDLMTFLAAEVPEVPAPAVTACLSKERFVVSGAKAGEAIADGPSLRDAINDVLSQQPQINALLQWESSARRAAGDVVSSLLNLFTRSQRFTNSYGTQLEGVLAHMATCAVGSDNVAADRRAAINEAFAPVLFDRMIHGSGTDVEAELWIQAITLATGLRGPDASHTHRLNALSHIALPSSGPMVAGDRGVVFSMSPSAGEFMAGKAAKGLNEVAAEFVHVIASSGGKSRAATAEEVNQGCRWVMLGTRAVCDQAQSHGSLRPVVLGLEVSADTVKKGATNLRLKTHGAIFLTPIFQPEPGSGFPEGSRLIIVNWHWVTSLGPNELSGAIVLYRLREAAMNALGSGVSNYTARPGIIDFSEKYHWTSG